jgi:FlaA1/EpsC-like NDP-sugar epimerase
VTGACRLTIEEYILVAWRYVATHRAGSEIIGGSSLAILVTGGAGYIGSHAARALRRSAYEVVIYDNLSSGFRRLARGFELVEGDIADEAKLRQVLARVDAVMHFAAHT